MRHVSDGVLRRLADEPDSVADRNAQHTSMCRRCRARQQRIVADSAFAQRLLGGPQLLPNVDAAWSRLVATPASVRGARVERAAPRSWRLAGVSVSSGMAIGGAGLVVAGAAAAVTLTAVVAPRHVAPIPVATGDLQSFVSAVGLSGPAGLAGVASPNGTKQLGFGVVTWSAGGGPRTYPTLALAEAASGLAIGFPRHCRRVYRALRATPSIPLSGRR